jgi:hypothetical protein
VFRPDVRLQELPSSEALLTERTAGVFELVQVAELNVPPAVGPLVCRPLANGAQPGSASQVFDVVFGLGAVHDVVEIGCSTICNSGSFGVETFL